MDGARLPERDRLDRREGLLEFLNEKPASFSPLDTAQLALLAPEDRAEYDHRRLEHLGGDIVLRLPKFLEVIEALKRASRFNRADIPRSRPRRMGRRAVLVVGETGTGKTTSCLAALQDRWYDLKRAGELMPDGDCPFVYIEVPPAATAKSMLAAFADFFNLPYTDRDSLPQLQNRVINYLVDRRRDLRFVVIDELQNLSVRTTTTGASAQVIKALYNRVQATFVFAGTSIDEAGPITGPSGAQITGRSIPVYLDNYPLGNSGRGASTQEIRDRETWLNVVGMFGDELCLTGTTAASVQRMGPYLHRRTRGSIGALAQLLTMGAVRLIESRLAAGNERLTVALLDEITLDLKTEMAADFYRGGTANAP
ncbi:ATP-binding protein [Leifsonia sp. NPDC056665]|uniref:ATP-binding protein n=1 Tax=Leifsonia sp. NPDC056665 TaxID=3345901 RepID=UPI0036A6F146